MATLGQMTKPMQANTFTTGQGQYALAPLQGQDLQDMLGAQQGHYNAGLAGRLGDNYNNYANAYGVGGQFYDPAAISAAGVAANRSGAAYQPGGMFYSGPPVGGAPAGGGAANGGPSLTGGTPGPTPAGGGYGGAMQPLNQPGGNVQPSGGAQPDWSKLDIAKFMQPNVDFLIGQGSKAIQNSAAAKGGLLSGNTLQGVNDYAQNTAQQAYGAAQNAAFNDRSFMRGNYQNDRDYQTALDQWNQNFGQNQYQFNTGANQFQQNLAQRQNEFNTGQGNWQQQFNYGIDNNDRNFAYNAMNNDRSFNSGLGLNLAQLGMQGSGQQNLLNQWLGNMLAGNNLSIGQTNANAAIGGNNATNSAISQFIQQLLSQGMLNRFAPSPTGGP